MAAEAAGHDVVSQIFAGQRSDRTNGDATSRADGECVASEASQAEEARCRAALEEQARRDAEEAEAKRLEQEEVEVKRLEQEAEAKRLEQEAEAKRLEQEAEAKRLEQEVEAKRLEQEAEAKRLEQEAEAKRLEQEAEAKRLEQEVEAKRLEQKAEAKRLEQEAEAKRLEQEAEAKRLKQEAEAKRLEQEAEAMRLELEFEAKRLEQEAETKRLEQKAEAKRLEQEGMVEQRSTGICYDATRRASLASQETDRDTVEVLSVCISRDAVASPASPRKAVEIVASEIAKSARDQAYTTLPRTAQEKSHSAGSRDAAENAGERGQHRVAAVAQARTQSSSLVRQHSGAFADEVASRVPAHNSQMVSQHSGASADEVASRESARSSVAERELAAKALVPTDLTGNQWSPQTSHESQVMTAHSSRVRSIESSLVEAEIAAAALAQASDAVSIFEPSQPSKESVYTASGSSRESRGQWQASDAVSLLEPSQQSKESIYTASGGGSRDSFESVAAAAAANDVVNILKGSAYYANLIANDSASLASSRQHSKSEIVSCYTSVESSSVRVSGVSALGISLTNDPACLPEARCDQSKSHGSKHPKSVSNDSINSTTLGNTMGASSNLGFSLTNDSASPLGATRIHSKTDERHSKRNSHESMTRVPTESSTVGIQAVGLFLTSDSICPADGRSEQSKKDNHQFSKGSASHEAAIASAAMFTTPECDSDRGLNFAAPPRCSAATPGSTDTAVDGSQHYPDQAELATPARISPGETAKCLTQREELEAVEVIQSQSGAACAEKSDWV